MRNMTNNLLTRLKKLKKRRPNLGVLSVSEMLRLLTVGHPIKGLAMPVEDQEALIAEVTERSRNMGTTEELIQKLAGQALPIGLKELPPVEQTVAQMTDTELLERIGLGKPTANQPAPPVTRLECGPSRTGQVPSCH
jgi:hypothetical protein